ncbi:MAG: sulfite exporter TauE/SafE family protein [Victivallaceae bacterium]
MDFFTVDFSSQQMLLLVFCAFMAGVSKTGLPGVAVLNVPLLAMAFQAKMSTGLLLPILAIADIFAVAYYRRHAQWHHIWRLLPWALAGIGAGSLVIRFISDAQLKPIIGFIVLAMLALNFWRTHRAGETVTIPKHWAFAAVMGFTAGLTTQLANAAGPVMVIYLLAMQLPKNEYIGTGAWYFLILNWLKIPLFIWDGRISAASVKADLLMLPAIALGAFLGIVLLKKIPQKWFNITVQFLALAAAIKLCCSVTDLFR